MSIGWSRDSNCVEATPCGGCSTIVGYSLFPQKFSRDPEHVLSLFLAQSPQSLITEAWSQFWVTLVGQTLPVLQHHRLLPAKFLLEEMLQLVR